MSLDSGKVPAPTRNFFSKPYLNKHKHRIVNYDYLQAAGISIGSGDLESKIKQIAHRLKITGASWESGNVPQVLCHRCAYLNGCLF